MKHLSISFLVRVLILSFFTIFPQSVISGKTSSEEIYSLAIKSLKKYQKSGSKSDRWKAEDMMREAAESGSAKAQYCIYLMSEQYELPDGYIYTDIKISKEEGAENLLKAAESGYLDAIAQLAYLHNNFSSKGLIEYNKGKAYDYCKKLVAANDYRAYPLMGEFYEYGICVEQDYKKAIEWYLKAFEIGKCYNLADDIALLYYQVSDYENAEKMFEKYFRLAKNGKLGWGIMNLKDYKLMAWIESCFGKGDFDKAISINNQYSQTKITGLSGKDIKNWAREKYDLLYGLEAYFEDYYTEEWSHPQKSVILNHIYCTDSNPSPEICYTRGRKIISFNKNCSTSDREVNFLMALPWLEKARGYKDELGQFSLWVGQEFAKDKNFNKAKEWFERSVQYGERLGNRLLAELYENPCDTTLECDYKTAFTYWEKIAATNDAYGLYTLGRYFNEGLAHTPNMGKAMEYFHKAANLESDEASLYAMDNLASCYISQKDWVNAFYWLDKAYSKDFMVVCHNLGDMYYHGNGTDQSYTKAFEIFSNGLESNSHCKYRVAYMLRNGLGTDIDYGRSNSLLKEAADENNARALYLLGTLLYSGDNITQDYKSSINYFESALKDNYLPDATRGEIYRTLSTCYRFGRGVTIDIPKADELISIAASYGDSNAKIINDWLNNK